MQFCTVLPIHRRGKPLCSMSNIYPTNLSFTKGILLQFPSVWLIHPSASCFGRSKKMSLFFFLLLRKIVKYLNAGYFFIFLWNASGQGYSNCVLWCPAIQSPIVIWLVFVASLSGGISWSSSCRVSVWLQRALFCVHVPWKDVCQGVVVKTAVGFVTDRVFSSFLIFFNGTWKN